MAVAAVLGLVACAIGAMVVMCGAAVSLAPAPMPAWLERYAALRPLVREAPRVGFCGSKNTFFRAQYVLAPLVLEAVYSGPRAAHPPVVIVDLAERVDVADASEGADPAECLREATQPPGTAARVHRVKPDLLLVELQPGAGGS